MTVIFTYYDFKKGRVSSRTFRTIAILDAVIIVTLIIWFALVFKG